MPVDAGYVALRAALIIGQEPRLRRFLASAQAPENPQWALLERILAANARTSFGADHSFGTIRTVADYRRAVPVQTYEDLRHHVERQELTGEKLLTDEQPVYYNRTSGTLGDPQEHPAHRGRPQAAQDPPAAGHPCVVQERARSCRARCSWWAGPGSRATWPGGTPYGSATGLLRENQPRLLRRRYTLPSSVNTVEDYESRYIIMAVLGLADPEVTSIGTANPSTLMRLLTVGARTRRHDPARGWPTAGCPTI